MTFTHDLLVIGAGAGGLTVAGGAAMFGLRVALIEQGEMGGDCLNSGCVPSKALIAAAARAHDAGERLGVTLKAQTDFRAVMRHVHGAIAEIAPVDSQERFEGLGVEVILARAVFVDPHTLEVGGRTLSAPRIVVATGSRPATPDIPGLAETPHLTNETLWALDTLPSHLAIIGGGAIGMEMAQAFRRLGSAVTLIATYPPMPRDDRDAAGIVIAALRDEGVAFHFDTNTERVERAASGVALTLAGGKRIEASQLLVAAGRAANTCGYGLDRAGVAFTDKGITVDQRRRTTARHIFAIGDCRDGPRFTHVSGYEGTVALMNIALGLPTKADYRALPWVTYTDPELAQIGLTEAAAREKHGDVEVIREDFSHNDRAIAEGRTAGFVKIVRRKGKVLGATIVGHHAGELLAPWGMAIAGKSSTFGMAGLIFAYPNRSELSKAVAFKAHEGLVFGSAARRWAGLLARLRR